MADNTTETETLQRIARALAEASPFLGQNDDRWLHRVKAWDKANPTGPAPPDGTFCDSVTERAANLIRLGYLVPGDPAGWANSGTPVATLFCERKGGERDCFVPQYYYGGSAEVDRASEILGDLYFEWVNSAVAQVWPA